MNSPARPLGQEDRKVLYELLSGLAYHTLKPYIVAACRVRKHHYCVAKVPSLLETCINVMLLSFRQQEECFSRIIVCIACPMG